MGQTSPKRVSSLEQSTKHGGRTPRDEFSRSPSIRGKLVADESPRIEDDDHLSTRSPVMSFLFNVACGCVREARPICRSHPSTSRRIVVRLALSIGRPDNREAEGHASGSTAPRMIFASGSGEPRPCRGTPAWLRRSQSSAVDANYPAFIVPRIAAIQNAANPAGILKPREHKIQSGNQQQLGVSGRRSRIPTCAPGRAVSSKGQRSAERHHCARDTQDRDAS